jgi:hypothetical protein
VSDKTSTSQQQQKESNQIHKNNNKKMNCKLNFAIFFAFLVSNGLSMAISNSENENEPATAYETSDTMDDQLGLNERKRETLRTICLNLGMPDKWAQLDKVTKDKCVYALLNHLYKNTNKSNTINYTRFSAASESNRDRREMKNFFSLDMSQNKPLNQQHSSNDKTFFKYGRK